MAWATRLHGAYESLEKAGMLRHGVRLVVASGIGTQHYCEMKVEQQLIHGDIETESKLEGRRLHDIGTKAAHRENLQLMNSS